MQYGKILPARFLSRPNRFVARVEAEGEELVCHVKNTGRCRELLVPGATVWLEESPNPSRKTKFDLIAVEKGDRLINMDAQAPNKVFGEHCLFPRSPGRPEVSGGVSAGDGCGPGTAGRADLCSAIVAAGVLRGGNGAGHRNGGTADHRHGGPGDGDPQPPGWGSLRPVPTYWVEY